MSWLRPEAVAKLKQWREAGVGLAVLFAGGWMMLTQLGLGILAGAIVALIGAGLLLTGTRHALFHTDTDAPGMVSVTEGRVTYFGPVIGGTIALSELQEIHFSRTPDGQSFWRLHGHEPQPLIIPAGAAGVDALLDTFTALPRFDTGRMVQAVQLRTATSRVIWRHPARRTRAEALT